MIDLRNLFRRNPPLPRLKLQYDWVGDGYDLAIEFFRGMRHWRTEMQQVQAILGPHFRAYSIGSGTHRLKFDDDIASSYGKKSIYPDPLEHWRGKVRELQALLGKAKLSTQTWEGSPPRFEAEWLLKGYRTDYWQAGLYSSVHPVSLKVEITQGLGPDCEVTYTEEPGIIRKAHISPLCVGLATNIEV